MEIFYVMRNKNSYLFDELDYNGTSECEPQIKLYFDQT